MTIKRYRMWETSVGSVLKEETGGELCYYHEHKAEIESLRSELAVERSLECRWSGTCDYYEPRPVPVADAGGES
jgi:hypothetical protein